MLKSTNQFIDTIADFRTVFQPNHKFVSFDVESLFTNVPADLVINTAADLVYSNDSTNTPNFDKSVFIQLLKFAITGCFMFNGSTYKQIDGITNVVWDRR